MPQEFWFNGKAATWLSTCELACLYLENGGGDCFARPRLAWDHISNASFMPHDRFTLTINMPRLQSIRGSPSSLPQPHLVLSSCSDGYSIPGGDM